MCVAFAKLRDREYCFRAKLFVHNLLVYDYLFNECRSDLLGIPVTHCNNLSATEGSCFDDPKMTCTNGIEDARPLNIDYRDRVYHGQFRSISMYVLCIYVCGLHILHTCTCIWL